MNELEIRKIVQEELRAQAYQSGAPIVPRHVHNNVDSPKINRSNVINTIGIMGKINFTSNSIYTLNFSSPNPSRLDLNGFTFDTGATNSSVLTVGVALLSKAYYFQPQTNRTAVEGGTPYPIGGVLAQCSSNLYVKDGANPSVTWPRTDQFYILNAYTATSTPIATMQAQNLTATSIDLAITNLLSGWNIAANFIIT